MRIAERANDSFSSLVAFGLLASWFVHVLENVGMTLNLMPITGIPLPFFSYGGSFMLASWLAIGILLRISSEGRGGGPYSWRSEPVSPGPSHLHSDVLVPQGEEAAAAPSRERGAAGDPAGRLGEVRGVRPHGFA